MTRPIWTTALPDWEKRILARELLTPCAPLFPSEAAAAREIFDQLRIVDVLGKPTFGEASRPWVSSFVESIFGAYDPDAGRRLITEFFMLISKKNSKDLCLTTPIPTPTGWTTMGDIKVGDKIFGVNGRQITVTATSEVFQDNECYLVEFSNGETVTAGAGHLWLTSALADAPGSKKGNNGDVRQRRTRVRTTAEIAQTLFRPGDLARNHSMPMPRPLECAPVELPIAPYTLGVWLGNGHSAAAKITCRDDDVELFDAIRAEGWPVRSSVNSSGAASTYTLSYGGRTKDEREGSLTTKLREHGLLDNKHIPEVYFRASFDQRLALLQGLMDTDGTIDKGGRVLSYCGINERLVRGVSELVSTFGIKNTLLSRPAKLNGRIICDAFYVQFMSFRDVVPVFKLTRKLDRMRRSDAWQNSARSRTVQIVNAARVSSVPTKCITVDAPDHQFLFGRSMLPTHNSTIAAGIMLTALLLNWRESAEFLILAPTVEVANNSFRPARDAVKADEELDALLLVQDHIRTITHRTTGAVLKVVAAESDTVSGKKATGVLVDELWAFGTKPNAHSMLLEATGGLTSRPEGFVIYLSTQSDEPPAGVFDEKLRYARDVRDGKVNDPQFMPILYEFPDSVLRERMHLDKKNFYVTNPNLGTSVDIPYIEREFDKNLRAGESQLKSFLAKHLNIQVALSMSADRWAGADYWEAAAEPALVLQRILERSEVVTIGIDGGGLDDLLGLAVIGRERGTRRWLLWTHAWAHRIVLSRRKDIATQLLGFEADGDLTIVEKPGDDVQAVADLICGIRDRGLLPEEDAIGVDAAGIGDINDELTTEERGFTLNKEIKAVGQGWRLNGAIKTTERKIAGRDLVHCGSRLMNFCVGNAKAEVRSNAILITKQVSGSAKIDPLMATFNAVAFMALNPEAAQSEPSVRWL